MLQDRTTYEVTLGELEALRSYVAELAGPAEAAAAERLLGQLAALQQHHAGEARDVRVAFSPVPAARQLAERAVDGLRGEGEVRMGGRRWRVQRPSRSSASKIRFAPGSSPGDGAS